MAATPFARALQQIDAGPGGATVAPFVRVAHVSAGGVQTVVGSGFFIDPWPAWIITARHVVSPQGQLPEAILVRAQTDAGDFIAFRGVAYAFPKETSTDMDCAVVCLASAVGGLTQPMPFPGWPTDDFDALVAGITEGDDALTQIPVRARRHGRLLTYLSGEGRNGMSGGPVLANGGVVGVHRGLNPNGVLLDFDDVLNPCMNAAAQAAGQ